MPTKVTCYARFSPRPDAATSESNDTQRDLCRAYATKQGWEIVAEFADAALSGKDHERPGLWAAMDALKRGMVLLVLKMDRLARDVYLSHTLDREILAKGARLVSVMNEGTWEDRPEDKLIAASFASSTSTTARSPPPAPAPPCCATRPRGGSWAATRPTARCSTALDL